MSLFRSAALFAIVCASAVQAAGPHVMPWRDRSAGSRAIDVVNQAVTGTPHLNYYGGRILDQPKVYSVNWGSGVNSTVQSRIGDFYAAFLTSPLMDWLTEYNTDIKAQGGQQGTNQHLQHGSFGGSIQITPGNTKTSLTDDDIKAELKAQIAAGKLPTPDGNSLLMINFPPLSSASGVFFPPVSRDTAVHVP